MYTNLSFYYGAMNSGKSTSALQLAHQYERAGHDVHLYTSGDRSGEAKISSRMGMAVESDLFNTETDFAFELAFLSGVVIIDEAQFLTVSQVEDLYVLTMCDLDITCFGLLTDFRRVLFPGSRRLMELSDKVYQLQNRSLCWCGDAALVNSRAVNGVVVYDGPQILVGDVNAEEVTYVVLCKLHYETGKLRG